MKKKKPSWLWLPGVLYLVQLVFCPLASAEKSSEPPADLVILNLNNLQPGKALPAGWQLQTFSGVQKPTTYRLTQASDVATPVIAAAADHSAAGLTRRLDVDPSQYPTLSWRWKVSGVLERAVLSEQTGDDSAARLLVSFGTNWLKGGLPRGTLCYVRGSVEPVGTMITSPYRSDVVSIVVSSGRATVGIWETLHRHLIDDYLRAFGEQPGDIRAISLMSDTDNTGSSVFAWYGEIRLSAE